MAAYRHSPLGDEPDATRLIKVLGTDQGGNINIAIRNTTLRGNKFIALSYVWGDEPASHRVSIGGRRSWVRPNLYSFLIHAAKSLRKDDLWIDALCIDQDNQPEKMRLIPQMGEIYSQANKVVVWLHDDAETSRTIALRGDDLNLLSGILSGGGWRAMFKRVNLAGKEKAAARQLRRLLDHEYWERLWTVQELEFAKRIEIYWYHFVFSWDVLIRILGNEWMASADMDIPDKNVAGTMKELRLEDNHPLATRFQREFWIDQDGGEEVTPRAQRRITSYALTHLMLEHKGYKCRIPHDRVFALLPLADDMGHLKVSYSDVPEALLARVFELSEDDHAVATKTIGKPLGIDIKKLNAKAIGACKVRSDGSSRQVQSLSKVRMCKYCLGIEAWQTALKKYHRRPQYISVFCFPGTSFRFGTFWWDDGVDVVVYGPLVVSSSTDSSGHLLYTLHIDKQSEERYATLVHRYNEVRRRRFDASLDAAFLEDLECFDQYRTTLYDSTLLHDCIDGGKEGWSEVKLRLYDWDQLTRILEVATRPGDFSSSVCAGLITRSIRANIKKASITEGKKPKHATRRPVPERISPKEWEELERDRNGF